MGSSKYTTRSAPCKRHNAEDLKKVIIDSFGDKPSLIVDVLNKCSAAHGGTRHRWYRVFVMLLNEKQIRRVYGGKVGRHKIYCVNKQETLPRLKHRLDEPFLCYFVDQSLYEGQNANCPR